MIHEPQIRKARETVHIELAQNISGIPLLQLQFCPLALLKINTAPMFLDRGSRNEILYLCVSGRFQYSLGYTEENHATAKTGSKPKVIRNGGIPNTSLKTLPLHQLAFLYIINVLFIIKLYSYSEATVV